MRDFFSPHLTHKFHIHFVNMWYRHNDWTHSIMAFCVIIRWKLSNSLWDSYTAFDIGHLVWVWFSLFLYGFRSFISIYTHFSGVCQLYDFSIPLHLVDLYDSEMNFKAFGCVDETDNNTLEIWSHNVKENHTHLNSLCEWNAVIHNAMMPLKFRLLLRTNAM